MAIHDQTDLDLMNETGSRTGKDRRKNEDKKPAAQRRKVQRRRQIDPTTCERDYSNDEIEFMQALDQYKRDSGRMFPTCSEILEVIRALGYVKSEWIDSKQIESEAREDGQCEPLESVQPPSSPKFRSLEDIESTIDTFGEFPE